MFEPDQPAENDVAASPSLYRKWRSRDFSDVVGQSHITQTLRNAVLMRKVGHAYLFTGPRGTGKTSTARILARAVNCLMPRDGEPCNACASCRSMLENRCLDVVEIDAASNNSVDNVRDLREKVNFSPAEVARKVYIIDEVHMLSTSAFNALLKTLEEPPAHVLFVLATTDVHKVPATITSRCQRLDFRAIAPRDIAARMAYICAQEGITASDAALEMIAQQATGSLRDALSLLEQVRAYEGAAIDVAEVEAALGLARRETLAQLSDAIAAGDTGAALTLIGELAAAGADMRQYARQIVQYWRDLLLLRAGGTRALGYTPDEATAALAERLTERDVTAVLKAFLQPDYSGRKSASAQWQLELAVAEACQNFATSGAPERAASAGMPPARPTAVTIAPGQTSTSSRTRAAAEPPATQPAQSEAPEPPWPDDAVPLEAYPAPQAARNTIPPRDNGATPVPEPMPPAASSGRQSPAPADNERAETAARHDGAVSPGASTTPPSTTTSASVGDVRQLWAQARRLLKRPVDAYLNGSCSPVELDGDALVLAFPLQSSFHKEQVEKPQNRGAIEEALTRVVGRPVSLRCVTMNRQSPAEESASAPPRDTFLDDAARRLRGVHMERNQP